MNVLAINGSPHLDDGNTAMILSPFLDEMKETGANVELFCTRKLKFGPCDGDMSCCFKNPGKCGQEELLAEVSKRLMSDEDYKKGMNEMMEQMKKSMAQ